MSRQLPARPNLEHLKNLAKQRLVDLRQQDPDAKLADALHLVAREYGFASWPKLKAEVERLLVAPASTEAAESPFIGVWRADVARSTRHPANQFQQATLQFVVSGDTITV